MRPTTTLHTGRRWKGPRAFRFCFRILRSFDSMARLLSTSCSLVLGNLSPSLSLLLELLSYYLSVCIITFGYTSFEFESGVFDHRKESIITISTRRVEILSILGFNRFKERVCLLYFPSVLAKPGVWKHVLYIFCLCYYCRLVQGAYWLIWLCWISLCVCDIHCVYFVFWYPERIGIGQKMFLLVAVFVLWNCWFISFATHSIDVASIYIYINLGRKFNVAYANFLLLLHVLLPVIGSGLQILISIVDIKWNWTASTHIHMMYVNWYQLIHACTAIMYCLESQASMHVHFSNTEYVTSMSICISSYIHQLIW